MDRDESIHLRAARLTAIAAVVGALIGAGAMYLTRDKSSSHAHYGTASTLSADLKLMQWWLAIEAASGLFRPPLAPPVEPLTRSQEETLAKRLGSKWIDLKVDLITIREYMDHYSNSKAAEDVKAGLTPSISNSEIRRIEDDVIPSILEAVAVLDEITR